VTVLASALWGLLGGFAVEGIEIAAMLRSTGNWPWRPRKKAAPFLASVVIRLAVGAALAAAVGATGPTGPLSAFAVGVAAPLIIEKLAQQIPVIPESSATQRNALPIRQTGRPPAGQFDQNLAGGEQTGHSGPTSETESSGALDAT
jgi:hypothetical protein